MIVCGFILTACGHPPLEKKPVVPVVTPQPRPAPAPVIDRPMRGVWLATVQHLDWPPLNTVNMTDDAERIRAQQNALIDKLDNLASVGVNTIFFQVKPDASALYHSNILPWSDVLTGENGKDPGYDPLQFMLTEAHRRGMKVHAWLNPYRVSMDTSASTVAALRRTLSGSPASVFALHPDWVRTASHRFVLDPGVPEVREWIASVVAELVTRYAVDGIQFDDYFYYETPTSRLDDRTSWRQYGQGFADKASWRRNNTLLLVKDISRTIKSLRPEVEFGISPAGVWRNRGDDPQGSDTRGAAAYDQAFADTRLWVNEGLLDYIAPQIYWPFARQVARYDTLAKWWADVVRPSHTKLYIGVALYKVGQPSKMEPDWMVGGGVAELQRELDLNEALPEISGTILFREAFLRQPQTQQAVDYLRSRWQHPALQDEKTAPVRRGVFTRNGP